MEITYSKSVRFLPTFGGNEDAPKDKQFTVTVKPLDRAQFITVSSLMVELGVDPAQSGDQRGELKIGLEIAAKLVGIFEKYLTGNVTLIENLRLNGADVTVETLLNEAPLIALIIEIVMKVVEISQLSETDAKN